MVTIPGGLTDVLDSGSDQAKRLAGNSVATAIGGAVAGGLVVGAIVNATRSRKKKTRRTPKKKRRKARKKSKRGPKYARTAGKKKDRSTKRIRMTKNGQPYVILKSGKARFIKKSSAKSSRKRRGGRY